MVALTTESKLGTPMSNDVSPASNTTASRARNKIAAQAYRRPRLASLRITAGVPGKSVGNGHKGEVFMSFAITIAVINVVFVCSLFFMRYAGSQGRR